MTAAANPGLSILNLDAVRAAPVSREPYSFFLGNDVLKADAVDAIREDFPAIAKPGYLTVDEVALKGRFKALIEELESDEFSRIMGEKFGIDLVHLGLIMLVNLAFGLTTPPVGTALFVACKVGKISMEKLIPPLLPLLGCMMVVLMVVTYLPEIYWWLPRAFGLVK